MFTGLIRQFLYNKPAKSKLSFALRYSSSSDSAESQLEYMLLLLLCWINRLLTGKHSPDDPKTINRPRRLLLVCDMGVCSRSLIPSGANHARRLAISKNVTKIYLTCFCRMMDCVTITKNVKNFLVFRYRKIFILAKWWGKLLFIIMLFYRYIA